MSDINDKVKTAGRNSATEVRKAQLTVASKAKDAEECVMLLDMLGLLPAVDGRQAKAS